MKFYELLIHITYEVGNAERKTIVFGTKYSVGHMLISVESWLESLNEKDKNIIEIQFISLRKVKKEIIIL